MQISSTMYIRGPILFVKYQNVSVGVGELCAILAKKSVVYSPWKVAQRRTSLDWAQMLNTNRIHAMNMTVPTFVSLYQILNMVRHQTHQSWFAAALANRATKLTRKIAVPASKTKQKLLNLFVLVMAHNSNARMVDVFPQSGAVMEKMVNSFQFNLFLAFRTTLYIKQTLNYKYIEISIQYSFIPFLIIICIITIIRYW